MKIQKKLDHLILLASKAQPPHNDFCKLAMDMSRDTMRVQENLAHAIVELNVMLSGNGLAGTGTAEGGKAVQVRRITCAGGANAGYEQAIKSMLEQDRAAQQNAVSSSQNELQVDTQHAYARQPLYLPIPHTWRC